MQFRPAVKSPATSGFTLVELSIVLVIVGLVIGGVLVGRDLIRAAEIRATISQLEKYNSAVNTFRGKYGYLPGDMPDPYATQYGFKTRGTDCSGSACPGEDDGNGIIEGAFAFGAGGNSGLAEGSGETIMVWVDLSTANLIDGGFNTATPNTYQGSISGAVLNNWLPQTKLGQGNYVYAWSGGINVVTVSDSLNYFGLSAVQQIDYGGSSRYIWSTAGLSVLQAYTIDTKMDDGFPQTGRVTVMYLGFNQGASWAAGGGGARSNSFGAADTSATTGSAATCYDNSASNSGTPGVTGAVQHYSLEMSNGTGINCALSFRFQ